MKVTHEHLDNIPPVTEITSLELNSRFSFYRPNYLVIQAVDFVALISNAPQLHTIKLSDVAFDGDIRLVASALSTCVSLRKLDLTFLAVTWSRWTCEDGTVLLETIGQMHWLEHVYLNFEAHLTWPVIAPLFSANSSVKSFNISAAKILEAGSSTFSSNFSGGITSCSPSLTELSIREIDHRFTAPEVEIIIAKQKTLQHISIVLKDNEDLVGIANALAVNDCLKDLFLYTRPDPRSYYDSVMAFRDVFAEANLTLEYLSLLWLTEDAHGRLRGMATRLFKAARRKHTKAARREIRRKSQELAQTIQQKYRELDFYIYLNKLGRKKLLTGNPSTDDWTTYFAEASARVRPAKQAYRDIFFDGVAEIFYYLSENPGLIVRAVNHTKTIDGN